MGILIQNYTTGEGFLVPELYVQVESMRILKTQGGGDYGCSFTSLAYKSYDDMVAGARPIPIPPYLANAEIFLTARQFYEQTIFGFAYAALKESWQAAGYTVQDFYPSPPTPTTYIYDCSGYNINGFNCAGYDKDGYDKDGFNALGYDKDGYDRQGFNHDGFDREGYGVDGYNKEGYNRQGYDRDGYNREGYDKDGCNRNHQDINGNPCPATQ